VFITAAATDQVLIAEFRSTEPKATVRLPEWFAG
jgi:hypothetical protein